MTGRSDPFASFVELLSTHLDEHDLRSTDLAAKLHLSRSHFDRLLGAIAGETPARFRRRILLERAGYRLRTGDAGVLDVALEAGYGSSEAFSRAFARAYGLAPTPWRSSRAAIHLPSPNRVHFHPPGGLRLPARGRVSSVTFVSQLVDHHIGLLGQFLDRAGVLSDDQLDAPIELSIVGIDAAPTIRSLLSRLVGQMDMWNASMASEPYDFGIERRESIGSMRERLDRAGATFTEYVREVGERDGFDETFVDATGDTPYVFTAAGMIAHVITYAAYRRTVVVGALAAAGAGEVDDEPLHWFAPADP